MRIESMNPYRPTVRAGTIEQVNHDWNGRTLRGQPISVANDPGCVKTRCCYYDSPVILGGIDEALC
jgi:hypothetical protein